jgi:5-methylcytosine-specific restriction protein A
MTWGTKSRQERGYGAGWDKKRKRILSRDGGLCQCKQCRDSGIPLIANEADHVVPKAKARAAGWSDGRIEADDNLQSLNGDCHKRKTQEEQDKGYRPKVAIGFDGFPIEG